MRTKIKEELINISEKEGNLDLLEAPFVIQCNDEFHRISYKVKEKKGVLDSDAIFFEWSEWVKREVKKLNIQNEK